MSTRRLFVIVLIAAILGGFISYIISKSLSESTEPQYVSVQDRQKMVLSNYDRITVPEGLNFVYAANVVTPAVVYIFTYNEYGTEILDGFFDRRRGIASSGSGVILTDDGYVVTNNHVVQNSRKIMVKLNDNREYEARLVGRDRNTDIALLKISEEELPFVKYGDSDQLELGEWVLAIGNPFELYSTVTAGIVSAKGRGSMGILSNETRLHIESFIQTDAAVNPGNSGGALVNLNGELIGINTAIATKSGRYEGYSFAVPVTLVRKVVDDLVEFGKVKRGLLGVSIENVDARVAREQDLSVLTGVLISQVYTNSAAEEAGLEPGDVIVRINGNEVTTVAELQELVARYRPGDELKLIFLRKGKENETEVVLRESLGDEQMFLTREEESEELEGIGFEELTEVERKKLGINGGIRVLEIEGGRWAELGMKPGFIITHIDGYRIDSVEDLKMTLSGLEGEKIRILGISPDGKKTYFITKW